MDYVNSILFVLAAIIAAELWNNFGYFQEWRLHRNDPNWTGFDKKALKHDLLLGLCLGVGAIVYQQATVNTPIGFNIPDYTSFAIFVASVSALFGSVAAVDKVFVGGIIGIDSKTPSPQISQSKKIDVSDTSASTDR
jgi:hypothetical protein